MARRHDATKLSTLIDATKTLANYVHYHLAPHTRVPLHVPSHQPSPLLYDRFELSKEGAWPRFQAYHAQLIQYDCGRGLYTSWTEAHTGHTRLHFLVMFVCVTFFLSSLLAKT